MRLRRRHKQNRRYERGQALIEFIMLFPVVLAFVWYLVKVNMAINTSIVGQKHVRSQLFLKMLNHRDGPVDSEYEINFRDRSVFFLGVAGDVIEAGTRQPAPVIDIGVGLNPRQVPGTNDDPGEAPEGASRQRVRVRTAFGICTSRKPGTSGALGPFCGEVN